MAVASWPGLDGQGKPPWVGKVVTVWRQVRLMPQTTWSNLMNVVTQILSVLGKSTFDTVARWWDGVLRVCRVLQGRLSLYSSMAPPTRALSPGVPLSALRLLLTAAVCACVQRAHWHIVCIGKTNTLRGHHPR